MVCSKTPSKAVVSRLLDMGMTQAEAAKHLKIGVKRLRSVMKLHGIQSRTRSEARVMGEHVSSKDDTPSVESLPLIISDIDDLIKLGLEYPKNLEEAEQYIQNMGWRSLELDTSNDVRTCAMITPEMILSIVRTNKYRRESCKEQYS